MTWKQLRPSRTLYCLEPDKSVYPGVTEMKGAFTLQRGNNQQQLYWSLWCQRHVVAFGPYNKVKYIKTTCQVTHTHSLTHTPPDQKKDLKFILWWNSITGRDLMIRLINRYIYFNFFIIKLLKVLRHKPPVRLCRFASITKCDSHPTVISRK